MFLHGHFFLEVLLDAACHHIAGKGEEPWCKAGLGNKKAGNNEKNY